MHGVSDRVGIVVCVFLCTLVSECVCLRGCNCGKRESERMLIYNYDFLSDYEATVFAKWDDSIASET